MENEQSTIMMRLTLSGAERQQYDIKTTGWWPSDKAEGRTLVVKSGLTERSLVRVGGRSDRSELFAARCTVRSFFIEVVFLRWGGVLRLKHHLKPKKAEIIGVVFRLGGVLKTPPGQIGVVFYVETPPLFLV